MEYRETAWLVVSTCTSRDPPQLRVHHNDIHHINWISKYIRSCSMRYNQVIWWVSFQYLRHFSLLHLLFLLIMWHLLGHYALFPVSPWWLTLCPSKWVTLRNRYATGRSDVCSSDLKSSNRWNKHKCLKYWNDTHHNTWLVPHGSRPNVFQRPADVVGTVVTNLELWWWGGSPSVQVDIVGQVVSRYSMSAT